MSALRKIAYTPEKLDAGHRLAWLRETLADESISLSVKARALLTALLLHHGDGECFPGFRLLARMTGLNKNDIGEVREELRELGLISWYDPPGRLSSRYRLVGLEEWFAAKICVPETPACVPVESVCVPPTPTNAGTEPFEPSTKKEGGRVLKVVPSKGWPALDARAPDELKTKWLKHVQLTSESDGEVRLQASGPIASLAKQRILEMLKEGELRELALSVGIEPEKVTIDAPRCGGAPAREYGVVPLSKAGQDAMADKLEAQSDTTIESLASQPLGPNVTSIAAFRTKGTAPPKE